MKIVLFLSFSQLAKRFFLTAFVNTTLARASQVRTDGRVLDIFPMPDLAKGIFYEYLRIDDPISKDAVERVADGFPFLLAPLAQVKGISSPALSAANNAVSEENANGIVRAVANLADMVSSQTIGFAGWVQSSATGVASGVVNAARTAGDSARNLGDEMDRRRVQLLSHAMSVPEQGMQFLSARVQGVADNVRTRRDRRKGVVVVVVPPESSPHSTIPAAPRGRVFRSPMAKWLGDAPEAPLADEIGPIIYPTMNLTRSLFLFMVHLYLLLLLIVSMPGSYNTRTKLVVRKTCKRSSSSLDGESDTTSVSDGESTLKPILAIARTRVSTSMNRKSKTLLSGEGRSIHSEEDQPATSQEMKKSFSYFL